jgi:hypothetical protein
VSYDSNTSTSVDHDMSLTSVRLVGGTENPNDPIKVTLIFNRVLTGSPLPELPEGEGLMVNFRYDLELNITE